MDNTLISETWWTKLQLVEQVRLLGKYDVKTPSTAADRYTMWYKEVVAPWWKELGNYQFYLIKKYIKNSGRINEWDIINIYEREVIDFQPLPEETETINANELTAGSKIRYHFQLVSKLNKKVIRFDSRPSEGGRPGNLGYKSAQIAEQYGKDKLNNIKNKKDYQVKVIPVI